SPRRQLPNLTGPARGCPAPRISRGSDRATARDREAGSTTGSGRGGGGGPGEGFRVGDSGEQEVVLLVHVQVRVGLDGGETGVERLVAGARVGRQRVVARRGPQLLEDLAGAVVLGDQDGDRLVELGRVRRGAAVGDGDRQLPDGGE